MSDLVKMCGSKRRFEDKKEVTTFINFFRRTSRGRHGRPNDLRAYPCPNCKGWHLTKEVD